MERPVMHRVVCITVFLVW